ncbi:DUF1850 domain-containing protein [Pseudomonas sp. F1_0610]|uniref:DUF1850 domain-containing protein n=1 Tax=Pseudomonas sp. F1_0610 TaxID=3114284 RepID=UPI0039C17BFD
MPSKPVNRYFLLGLSALIVLSLSYALSTQSVFEFRSVSSLCYLSQQDFTLQWIHSVEKEAWREHYQQQNNQLVLTDTAFKTFGAGTPSMGTVLPSQDGWIHYQVMRKLPQLNWIVSNNVQSSVLSNKGIWPLYQQLTDYSEVNIKVVKLPRWQYFTQESCDDYFK